MRDLDFSPTAILIVAWGNVPGIVIDVVPPQGLESIDESQEKHGQTVDGGNAGGNERQDLDELVELWSTLPTSTRERCLAWLKSQAVQAGIRDA